MQKYKSNIKKTAIASIMAATALTMSSTVISKTALALENTDDILSAKTVDELEDRELNRKIRNYILNNPDVIIEALARGKEIAAQREAAQIRRIIAENAKDIFADPDSPEVGNKDADVTIVEFFDYNCSACRMMFRGLEILLLQDKNVRVIFKEFPIFGVDSEKISALSLAVNKVAPEKYYDFHAKMIKYPGKITIGIVGNLILQAGISQEQLEKIKILANSEEILEIIRKNKILGKKLKIQGTPALIINDELVPHAIDIGELQSKVAEHRKRISAIK